MDIRSLRYFLAVADTLNFTRAAKQLHINPSPLSRAIQQLEAEIGGSLFTRDTRKVELTVLGMALIPRAERAVAEVDSLTHDMQRRARGRADISLGFRSVPHDVLRSVTEATSAAGTDLIEVQLRPLLPRTQIRAVLAGDLDLAIVQEPIEHRSLSSLPILVETQGLALPEGALPPDAVATIDTLADFTILVPAGTDVITTAAFERIGVAAHDILVAEFDIVGGFAALIASGGYCCLVPMHPSAPWHQYVMAPGVAVRPFSPTLAPVTSVAWRSSRDNEGDLGPVLDRLRAAFPQPLRR
ncbi:LysR family transcriptional regulator [Actinosynnema sp. NPDC059335]|uniref:LysR family transcriptional regulator n=1 Tax=Actinosynnema sp. NPDC059335 TaxID=3346804 RepID=UPI00366A6E70